MSQREILLKITEDPNGHKVYLDDMSLEAAKIFKELLESITSIAALCSTQQDKVRINVFKQSAAVKIYPSETAYLKIVKGLNDVIDNNSKSSDIVSHCKVIQMQMRDSKYKFEFDLIESASNRKSLVKDFQRKKDFYKKREDKKRLSDNIEFLHGEMVDLGGSSKINFHIMRPDLDYGIKIRCKDKNEAIRVREYLYASTGIYVAVHKRVRQNSDDIRNFIDVYNSQKQFNEFKRFYEETSKLERQDRYLKFHELVFATLSETVDIDASLRKIRKYVRLYNNTWTDEGQLRTILVSLKSFLNHPILKEDLEAIMNRVKILSKQKNI